MSLKKYIPCRLQEAKPTRFYELLILATFLQLFVGVNLMGAPATDCFTNWPAGAEPREIGKRLAENFASRPFEFTTNPKREFIIYPEVITEYGALSVAQLTGDVGLQNQLIKKFVTFCRPEGNQHVSTRRHVDYEVFGLVPLKIYLINHDPTFLASGLAFADRQWAKTTPDGITDEARYWIDDMFMIPALETEAFRASGKTQYLDRTALTMTAYLERLQQSNGLFYHGTNEPFFWGRGNGWAAAGMTELLLSLPDDHPKRAEILANYRKMMAALLRFQGLDGLWHQLVDDPNTWPETSGSAMFAFALVTGVKEDWLDAATYGLSARKAWLALVGQLDAAGNLREVCVGTDKSESRKYYLDRPRETGNLHGQAPMLWTAAALLR